MTLREALNVAGFNWQSGGRSAWHPGKQWRVHEDLEGDRVLLEMRALGLYTEWAMLPDSQIDLDEEGWEPVQPPPECQSIEIPASAEVGDER